MRAPLKTALASWAPSINIIIIIIIIQAPRLPEMLSNSTKPEYVIKRGIMFHSCNL